jgi:tetratricopeptide (TPR) repeat protein
MELVEGTDLSEWAQEPRSQRAIIDVFLAAADGLRAVHAAGLLHRDFKPGNVLIGRDGSVRVADFGLAALAEDPALPTPRSGGSPEGASTRKWGAAGTPRYMAPEQHMSHALTPNCDQYAFCASLYEALLDCFPFAAVSVDELLRAKLVGPASASLARLPRRLARLLRRGLSPDPDARYPDMTALRDDLRRCRRRRSSPALALGAAALGTLAAFWPLAEARNDECPPSSEPQTIVASPTVDDAQLRQMLADVALAVTDYDADIRARWDGLCSLPVTERARARACLEQCDRALSDLRDALGGAAAEALAQGWRLVEALPDPYLCSTGSPTELEADGWDAVLARAEMHARLADFDQARAILLALRGELARTGAVRGERRVDLQLGRLALAENRFEDAARVLESVYSSADATGDAHAAAQAATGIVAACARRGDGEAARRWSKMARAQLERAEPRDPRQEVSLEHNLAIAHFESGRLGEALATALGAARHAERIGAEAEAFDARQLHAELLLHHGRPTEALEAHRELLDSPHADPVRVPGRHVLGLFGLGNAQYTRRDFAAACETFAAAHERATAVLGPDHPTTPSICVNHAQCIGERGDERARDRLRSCTSQLQERLGDEHPSVIMARAIDGRLLAAAGEPEAGAAVLLENAARLEGILGASHFAAIDLVHHAGVAKAAAGDHEEGLRHLLTALERRRRELPAGHVDTFDSLAQVALVEEALGRRADAHRDLALAIAGFEEREVDPSYIRMWRDRLTGKESER